MSYQTWPLTVQVVNLLAGFYLISLPNLVKGICHVSECLIRHCLDLEFLTYSSLIVSQMLLEIHAQATTHSYSTVDFGAWWDALEEAGLRAFSSELNYPAIHWNPFPTAM